MKTLTILAAAIATSFAFTADAAPYGPGPGCPAGATPGAAGCPAYGQGNGPGYGQRGGWGQRGGGWQKWDANGDGQLSRDEVANAPRLSQEFDALDANHDGFLAQPELQAAVTRMGLSVAEFRWAFRDETLHFDDGAAEPAIVADGKTSVCCVLREAPAGGDQRDWYTSVQFKRSSWPNFQCFR